jgi:hypothetical protein
MASEIGTFIVANYETAQPVEIAYESTPYCWIVETKNQPATGRQAARIRADLAGHPGRQRHSQANHGLRESYLEHTEAALEFMRVYVLESARMPAFCIKQAARMV